MGSTPESEMQLTTARGPAAQRGPGAGRPVVVNPLTADLLATSNNVFAAFLRTQHLEVTKHSSSGGFTPPPGARQLGFTPPPASSGFTPPPAGSGTTPLPVARLSPASSGFTPPPGKRPPAGGPSGSPASAGPSAGAGARADPSAGAGARADPLSAEQFVQTAIKLHHGPLVATAEQFVRLARGESDGIDPQSTTKAQMIATARKVLEGNAELRKTKCSDLEWRYRATQFVLVKLVKLMGGVGGDINVVCGIPPSSDLRYINLVLGVLLWGLSELHRDMEDSDLRNMAWFMWNTRPFSLVADSCFALAGNSKLTSGNSGLKGACLKFFRVLVPTVGVVLDVGTGPDFTLVVSGLSASRTLADEPVDEQTKNAMLDLSRKTGQEHYKGVVTRCLAKSFWKIMRSCMEPGAPKADLISKCLVTVHTRIRAGLLYAMGDVAAAQREDGSDPTFLAMENETEPLSDEGEPDLEDEAFVAKGGEPRTREEEAELAQFRAELQSGARQRQPPSSVPALPVRGAFGAPPVQGAFSAPPVQEAFSAPTVGQPRPRTEDRDPDAGRRKRRIILPTVVPH